ncbi:MAG TPA: hypothetical protein DDX04_09490, partial [Massilia sp.]|nr:hypothetical protein [Massilia sp.]
MLSQQIHAFDVGLIFLLQGNFVKLFETVSSMKRRSDDGLTQQCRTFLATSALDSDSEHATTQELDRLSRNRTTLIIAPRLSTIVNADLIVVMDRGRHTGRGAWKKRTGRLSAPASGP